ncbi:MAG: hypothetical protein AVDCRST_MAG53-386, partial [uncultured Solirubrobacteraceae bacterium]
DQIPAQGRAPAADRVGHRRPEARREAVGRGRRQPGARYRAGARPPGAAHPGRDPGGDALQTDPHGDGPRPARRRREVGGHLDRQDRRGRV